MMQETLSNIYRDMIEVKFRQEVIVIENCTRKKMDSFLKDFSESVQRFNEESSQMPVDY